MRGFCFEKSRGKSAAVRYFGKSFYAALSRITAAVLSLSLILLLFSGCGGGAEGKRAYDIMRKFADEYGIERTVFSPDVPEGEDGYCADGFLDRVFGNISECVSDYALIFISDLDAVGECAILVCYSGYDTIAVTEAALRRIDLLRRESGGLDSSNISTAFVERHGNAVILSVLPDNERALNLFDKLL